MVVYLAISTSNTKEDMLGNYVVLLLIALALIIITTISSKSKSRIIRILKSIIIGLIVIVNPITAFLIWSFLNCYSFFVAGPNSALFQCQVMDGVIVLYFSMAFVGLPGALLLWIMAVGFKKLFLNSSGTPSK